MNPFEIPAKPITVFITDPFEKNPLDESLFDFVIRTSSSKTAREDIASAVFNICMQITNTSPVVLVAQERSGTLIPGIGSGLRASFRKVIGYVLLMEHCQCQIKLHHLILNGWSIILILCP